MDLVELMLRVADDDPDALATRPRPPARAVPRWRPASTPRTWRATFNPVPGSSPMSVGPPGVRIDGWVESGTEVSAAYDPLLAKLIATGPDRATALRALGVALDASAVAGIETNLRFVARRLGHAGHAGGHPHHRHVGRDPLRRRPARHRAPGHAVDRPGVAGAAAFLVRRSAAFGPDGRSFLSGRQHGAGESRGAAGLELTLEGPAIVCSADDVGVRDGGTGAGHGRRRAGAHVAAGACAGRLHAGRGRHRTPGYPGLHPFRRGIGPARVPGQRRHLHARWAGRAGRARTAGRRRAPSAARPALRSGSRPDPSGGHPGLPQDWEIQVVPGPHAAPEFFTDDDLEVFYATAWEVHYNSARTGVGCWARARVGPQRRWRRRAASVEHPRHPLFGRRGQLHRRPAHPARAGRAEPRRVRLPGHGDQHGTLEAGAAASRRLGAVRPAAVGRSERPSPHGAGHDDLSGVLERRDGERDAGRHLPRQWRRQSAGRVRARWS